MENIKGVAQMTKITFHGQSVDAIDIFGDDGVERMFAAVGNCIIEVMHNGNEWVPYTK